MAVKWVAGLAMLMLGGCTGLPDWRLFDSAGMRTPVAHTAGNFDFAWQLSGDPDVAPLQVFDDGRRMWLQFVPGQAVPAIFASTSQGDRLLGYRREEPYVVLDQVWPHLVLRGGRQSSRVDRAGTGPSPSVALAGAAPEADAGKMAEPGVRPPSSAVADTMAVRIEADEAVVAVAAAPLPAQSANPVSVASSLAGQVAIPAPSPAQPDAALSSDGIGGSRLIEGPPDAPAVTSALAQFDVSPQDKNMRLALSRWADKAGWTFEAEHWSVDADIPIAGSAQFRSDFKQAVQALMASTEMADRPLQPCFYSNKVLRIVPYAQPCNRVAALSGAS